MRAPTVRILAIAAVVVLIAVSAARLWQGAAEPELIELPGASFSQQGSFDYKVALKPSTLYGTLPLVVVEDEGTAPQEQQDEDERYLFFRSIISDFYMSLTYDLEGQGALSTAAAEVEVVVYAEEPGLWEKDIERFFATQPKLPVTCDFVLDVDSIEKNVESIADDIGVNASSVKYRIDAIVRVDAKTIQGDVIEDTYVHSLTLKMDAKTVELVPPLESTGAVRGTGGAWSHRSRFDYEVFLHYNELFDEQVLRSMGLPTAQPEQSPVVIDGTPRQVLGPGHTYFPSLVEGIDAEFAYSFNCETPVQDLMHTVEVNVTLGSSDAWQKTLSLVQYREESGDFTVEFPIDIDFYARVVDAIATETGVKAGTHDVVIVADVLTSGVTPYGTINQSLQQTLKGTLSQSSLTFETEALSQVIPGTVGGGTRRVDDPQPASARIPWLVALAAGVAMLGFLVWNEVRLRSARLSPREREALQIAKKYRDLVISVDSVPSPRSGDISVTVRSMSELARVADDAVKPILHSAVDSTHLYAVLDGAVRYQYLISAAPSSE